MTPQPFAQPLRFQPIFKRLIWGGRRLGTLLNKPIGPETDYAESWELSDHRDDVSRVALGHLAGQSLRNLLHQHPLDLLGPGSPPTDQFPLLVKFLDARAVLSVQVHPDDSLARELCDDNGKTEAWVILHADPGSLIYAGLKSGVDRAAFEAAIRSGQVEPLLHRFHPKPGDCVFIPAGTVHAIGAGIVLAEIQQMSDATFRVFDWNRTGPDGRPRELHLEQALASIDFHRGPVNPVRTDPIHHPGYTAESLVACHAFAIDRLTVAQSAPIGRADRFAILIHLEGNASLRFQNRSFPSQPGQVWLLPSALGAGEVLTQPGQQAIVLLVWVP
jgi:mannose-6-phosphate isomerase